MEVLSKGTVEPILVATRDRLENLVTLNDVTNLQFDVKRASDGLIVQSNITALVDIDLPMTAICLIDTTIADYEVGDTYHLYLHWDAGSEHPRSNPLKFRVEDD